MSIPIEFIDGFDEYDPDDHHEDKLDALNFWLESNDIDVKPNSYIDENQADMYFCKEDKMGDCPPPGLNYGFYQFHMPPISLEKAEQWIENAQKRILREDALAANCFWN